MVNTIVNHRTYTRGITAILLTVMLLSAGCASTTGDEQTTTTVRTTDRPTETIPGTTTDETGPLWTTTETEATADAHSDSNATTETTAQEARDETADTDSDPGSTSVAAKRALDDSPTTADETTTTEETPTTEETTPTTTTEQTTTADETTTPKAEEPNHAEEFRTTVESSGINVTRVNQHSGGAFISYDTQYLQDANKQHAEMDDVILPFADAVANGWEADSLKATIYEGHGEILAHYTVERSWVTQYLNGQISYSELKERVDGTADWLYNAPDTTTTTTDRPSGRPTTSVIEGEDTTTDDETTVVATQEPEPNTTNTP